MESEERPTKIRKLDQDKIATEERLDHMRIPEDTNADAIFEDNSAGPINPTSNDEISAPADDSVASSTIPGDDSAKDAAPKLSKNQLKKQMRFERWEAGRDDRKAKRKEKIKARKERRREERRQNPPSQDGEASNGPKTRLRSSKAKDATQVPVTVIFDCDFEDFMFEQEQKSLGLQLTRCYSDNRKAPFPMHLAISSFGGKMKERFDGILAKQYTSWKGVRFFSEDFVEVAQKSKEWMQGDNGGVIAGALSKPSQDDQTADEGETVYLSSESDVTLERLSPNSTYIIGGLVDKNRHKGICYKRALDRGIKTAKLPIGEFLQMNSRQVLTTNHVLEIMIKWMESGDWGKAFMEVIPKRKGGVLKSELDEGGMEDDEVSPEDGDFGVATEGVDAVGADAAPAANLPAQDDAGSITANTSEEAH